MKECYSCGRHWERVLMEPVECRMCDAFHWICPECLDIMKLNSELIDEYEP